MINPYNDNNYESDSNFNLDLNNDYSYSSHSNTWDTGIDSSFNSDLHSDYQNYHSLDTINTWDSGFDYNSYGVYNSDDSHNYVLTPDSNNGIDFSVTENVVMWHGNCNYAGEIKGNSFYDSHGDLLGHLGSDMKIYDAHNVVRGYVTSDGCAYDNSGHLFASGGTSKWAAATYVYNTFSPA